MGRMLLFGQTGRKAQTPLPVCPWIWVLSVVPMNRPREISTAGQFEILAPLSVGGMGEVYLARRKGAHGFEKLIALKTIRPDLIQHEEMRRMFLDEARVLARLDHPAVAQVYDFVEGEAGLFLSMEYVPGVPLSKLMQKRQGPLPPEIVARIGVEVCRGLHAAHELTDLEGKPLGVVHRDVSPQNLMLTFDGRVKILDFGVAYMFDREATTTQTGLFKGKLAYIAPEQIAGKGADRRSDVYSLAVVMHELLTGRRLFSKGKGALADATTRKRIPKPSTIAPEVPKEFDTIVMKGLSMKQRSRYADTKEMAAALEEYLHTAGGESLESFAERELEEDKEHHRNWLQSVMDAPTGPTPATEPDRPPTKLVRPASKTGNIGATAILADKSIDVPLDSAIVSYLPDSPKRSGRLIGFAIILAALTAGAWLLFPSKMEEKAERIANWASDEAKPMINDVLQEGAQAFEDDPEIDRTEQERIEEEDPEAAEVEETDVADGELEGEPVVEAEGETAEELEAIPSSTGSALIGQKIDVPPPAAIIDTPPIPPAIKVEPKPSPPKAQPRKKPVQKRAVSKRSKPAVKSTKKVRYGSMSIMARPGGTIYVDGKRVGGTPLNRVRLKPGRHRVALIRGDPKPRWSSTVWVREGRHVLIRLK
jgi:serine/threonine protein kinase